MKPKKKPTVGPREEVSYSLRIPVALHEQLKAAAAADRRSLNLWLIIKLEKMVAAPDAR